MRPTASALNRLASQIGPQGLVRNSCVCVCVCVCRELIFLSWNMLGMKQAIVCVCVCVFVGSLFAHHGTSPEMQASGLTNIPGNCCGFLSSLR